MRFFITVALLVALAGPASANTVILDFEDVSIGVIPEPEVVTQGYVFNTVADPADGAGGFAQWKNSPTNNPTSIIRYCPYCSATMSAESGSSFNLLSLDMNTLDPQPDLTASFTLTGYYAGSGQVSVELTTDTTWSNYTFGTEWNNLVSLDFGAVITGGPFSAIGLDNVTLTAVPVPGAIWLFGSALAGLGWLRRKEAA